MPSLLRDVYKRQDFERPEFDMKCEALLPALSREVEVHFHAHRADDIFTAIRLAKEFQLDFVVVHGTCLLYTSRCV